LEAMILPGHNLPLPAGRLVKFVASNCRCVMSFSFLNFSKGQQLSRHPYRDLKLPLRQPYE
jgi:hypothetical protein